MVSHNDDEVTRMKNIEMIELGMHRIRPWYFSPYPQVRYIVYFAIPKAWFTPVLPHCLCKTCVSVESLLNDHRYQLVAAFTLWEEVSCSVNRSDSATVEWIQFRLLSTFVISELHQIYFDNLSTNSVFHMRLAHLVIFHCFRLSCFILIASCLIALLISFQLILF